MIPTVKSGLRWWACGWRVRSRTPGSRALHDGHSLRGVR